jgi:hypothetical protein
MVKVFDDPLSSGDQRAGALTASPVCAEVSQLSGDN